jgi:AmiR/NasT family two-component response regulator
MIMGKSRIVIIDDEPVIRMDFKEMLTLNGFEVAGEAADGFDAVELCRREKPDLVIMDIKMSVFDGLSAAEIILSEELSDCVILISAYNDKEFFKKAKRAGVMNYLIKPVREKVLIPAVEMALAKSLEIRNMKNKMAEMEEQFKNNKIIERAKHILSSSHNISEAEAYEKLRTLSMNKRCSMAKIAESILNQDPSKVYTEKAKAFLMKKYELSEQAAYQRIKHLSTEKKISLCDAAVQILGSTGK